MARARGSGSVRGRRQRGQATGRGRGPRTQRVGALQPVAQAQVVINMPQQRSQRIMASTCTWIKANNENKNI